MGLFEEKTLAGIVSLLEPTSTHKSRSVDVRKAFLMKRDEPDCDISFAWPTACDRGWCDTTAGAGRGRGEGGMPLIW